MGCGNYEHAFMTFVWISSVGGFACKGVLGDYWFRGWLFAFIGYISL
jgi:hypothetical protein